MARIVLRVVVAIAVAIAAFLIITSLLHVFYLAVLVALVAALAFGVFRIGRWSGRSRSSRS